MSTTVTHPETKTPAVQPPKQAAEVAMFVRRLSLFAAEFLALCVLFGYLHEHNYYMKDGATIVVDQKLRSLKAGDVAFDPGREPLLFAGDSRVLAGFRPDLFDELSGGRTHSFNLGLPGVTRTEVAEAVASLAESGCRLKYVLVFDSWAPPPEQQLPTGWPYSMFREAMPQRLFAATFGPSRQATLRYFFPFKNLLTDTSIFLIHSASNGGPVAQHRLNVKSTVDVMATRGYYYIQEQALYKDKKLPAGFRHPEDTPDKVYRRSVAYDGSVYDIWQSLADRYGITVVLVPPCLRETQNAPPPPGELDFPPPPNPRTRVIPSPAYWQYTNSKWSDLVHLNPDGAEQYTRDVFEAFRRYVPDRPPAQ